MKAENKTKTDEPQSRSTAGLGVALSFDEIEELIKFHRGSAMFGGLMSDDFGGERYHRQRADFLTRLLPRQSPNV